MMDGEKEYVILKSGKGHKGFAQCMEIAVHTCGSILSNLAEVICALYTSDFMCNLH